MSETVRDVLEPCVRRADGLVMPSDVSPWTALEDAGILDAHVIRGTCPTCGGEGWYVGTEAVRGLDGMPEPSPVQVQCDCPNAPVYVIAPEAMEVFVCALAKANEWLCSQAEIAMGEHREAAEMHAAPLLQALLPNARVAREVGEIRQNVRVRWAQPGNRYLTELLLAEGSTIAILEDD
ncbi:MAG: hypothetical protein KOO60_10810 [Gemmatimonadales bacterium]|nr:hypothetical protein [Gemmatimonadales bacterium]